MNENEPVAKKKNISSPLGGGPRKKSTPRPFAERLRAVKLHLEEGFTQELVAQQMGVSVAGFQRWLSVYRRHGEEGLKDRHRERSPSKLSEAVHEKILELKREEPTRGVKRISQLLRRIFFLPASAETVRQTLKKEGLVESPPKPKRNLTRPRFFERATPNQMWQTDIFTFRLGGKYAYVIGFMDDYSRFIVGADLFRSHTAENVLEVFRVAAGEYQPPKEMLTDNGREYVNWRGVTRFQAEMKKNGIHHFKSRPHHPMTLGKIERFWETLWQEFLSRAQFESFESARERIRLWIKYYNHKRPHQGIEGLCPADRYFEIASQLCAANPRLPSTWSAAWKVSRSSCGPKKVNSNSRSTMEPKTKNSNTTSSPTKRRRQPQPHLPATEKAQAVLAVWTDRCKASEVCRQLRINFMTLQQWQKRAMEGMLQALESRVNLAKGEALSPRLQALLSNRQRAMSTRKLATRLEQISLASKPQVAPKES